MEDDGVSEVLSSVLLLAVAVGLAGGFVVLLFGLPPPTPDPHLVVGTYVLPTEPDVLVLEHRGGGAVPLSDLQVALTVDGSTTTGTVGAFLRAGDRRWSVLSAGGDAKTATDLFLPGDRIRYEDAAVQGSAIALAVADLRTTSSVLASTSVQAADPTAPEMTSARTTSTTTIEVSFTEPLATVDPRDFDVDRATPSSAVLLGDGSRVELTVARFRPSDTPTVTSAPNPRGTEDLAGNALVGRQGVVAADGVAPAISAVSAGTPTSSSATVTWTTDESGNTSVLFGPTYSLGRAATGADGTAHSATLADLTEATPYFYRVSTTDAAGNTATSETQSFVTADDGSGGGGADATQHLRITGLPATIDQGGRTAAVTVTLRDAAGATVPSSASVLLATNSTDGWFTTADGAPIQAVTLSGGSATFRYVDHRVDGGTSVLSASLDGVVAGRAATRVVAHGVVGGSGAAALRAYVLYPSSQRLNDDSVTLAVALANPTPSAVTVESVSVRSEPTLGTGTSVFFRAAAHLASSDDPWESCPLAPSANTLTCTPRGRDASFTLPAYGLTQWAFLFTTSGSASSGYTVLTATFVTSLGETTSAIVPVRHSPSAAAPLVTFLPRDTAGDVDDTGGFGSTGMAPVRQDVAKAFHWEWDFEGAPAASDVLVTRVSIPAGWTSLTIPSQAIVTTHGAVVSAREPTADSPGWVEVRQTGMPGNGAERFFEFTATPPRIAGLQTFAVEMETLLGGTSASERTFAAAYLVPVRVQ